ncbi:MAG: hypothetical protein COB46_01365 [Rhodospirillaceae bacterium]|nr:MAG: hypothetical protein COB46_01365 [Rhodospirillaceae bacterium]
MPDTSPPIKSTFDNARLESYCQNLRDTLPIDKRNGRVLLVQIPQVMLDSFNREIALSRGYYTFPPTGLQYLHEAIKDRGVEVRILDLNYEFMQRVFEDPDFKITDWPQILEQVLDDYEPAIVGVSCLFDAGIQALLEVLRCVRKRNDAVVVSGGVIATYEWEKLLASNLGHFVIQGEGENKLNFLLDHLLDDSKGQTVTPGVFFDDGAGKTESSGAPDTVMIHGNLIDSYKTLPIEKYCHYGSLNPFSRSIDGPPISFAAIQFSRGCRAACTFCAVRDFMGKGVRHRSVDDLLAEIEYLYEQRGVRHFEWLDDDLLFYRDDIKTLLRAIIDKGWNLQWSANNGLIAASIDEELLGLIRDSGCIGFKIGIETGNEEMLRKVKKPGKHTKFLSFSRMLQGYPEVFVGGNFIIGLPEETFAQIMDSFRFALEIELDWSAVTVCQVIRGASAFSDSGEYFEHQMKSDGAVVKNFIPSRSSSHGHVSSVDVLSNLDIFKLPPHEEPSEEQAKEIWFAFNLIVNYVNNKNLMLGGRPEKFINWVRTAQRAYPTNPYMMLFLGLAYRVQGNDDEAQKCYHLAKSYVKSEYWVNRFKAFFLDELLTNFPENKEAVYESLNRISERQKVSCADWLALPRGSSPDDTLQK